MTSGKKEIRSFSVIDDGDDHGDDVANDDDVNADIDDDDDEMMARLKRCGVACCVYWANPSPEY